MNIIQGKLYADFRRMAWLMAMPICLTLTQPCIVEAEASADSQSETVEVQSVTPLKPSKADFEKQPRASKPNAPTVPQFAVPTGTQTFSAVVDDGDLMLVRCFEIPLAPESGDELPDENEALAKAITIYQGTPSDVAPLTSFLESHPNTRWKASLLADLGLKYLNQGRWSAALSAFEEAWNLAKESDNPRLKNVADRAIGELAMTYARLSDQAKLESVLKEVADRNVQGAGAARISEARDNLALMMNYPNKAFRCGAVAIKRIYHVIHPETPYPKAIGDLQAKTSAGISLDKIHELAKTLGLSYHMAYRPTGTALPPTPCVIHWKRGHFAALIGKDEGNFVLQDASFNNDMLVSPDILDEEGSGYYLIPEGLLPVGWREVAKAEAEKVFGKSVVRPNSTPSSPNHSVKAHDDGQNKDSDSKCPCPGMTVYDIDLATVGLILTDTPVGYTPPTGPSVYFTASYNSRESADMTSISNLGNKWSFNLLSYLKFSGSKAVIYGPGGGLSSYYYSSTVGGYITYNTSDVIKANTSSGYTLYHKDGSYDLYDVYSVSGSKTAAIFRSKTVDAIGNSITYAYDSGYRLRTVTDALDQVTVISYAGDSISSDSTAYYHISTVTDPFGRTATFAYSGQNLTSITDAIGITSSFVYGTGDLVTNLTTPYGMTTFTCADTVSGNETSSRLLIATDPAGNKERVEWVARSSDLSSADAAGAPSGFTNGYISYRNTFYWDKNAMSMAATEATGGIDYSSARITHWLHADDTTSSAVIESTKEPNENRVWRKYPGQGNTYTVGTSGQPIKIARLLDDGTEQDYQYEYNTANNITKSIDPLGRETDYDYADNGIDLLQVKQLNDTAYDTLAAYTYNDHHLPLTATDASGQTTTYTYNTAGQVRTVTNALGETTTYWYSATPTWTGAPIQDTNAVGYLVEIDGPVTGAYARFNYDGFGRLNSVTDSEGYTVVTTYDNLDRPTRITYPDGTYEQILYDRLDAEWLRDRLGRWTHQYHDSQRHLVKVVDPAYRSTIYDWCTCGALESIRDPEGHYTTWLRDIQSRVIGKAYADGTSESYVYENTTSRLKYTLDAKRQRTNYTYNKDNSISAISYTASDGTTALDPATAGVSYTYDTAYSRVLTMTDGTGTTTYVYNAISAALGSGRLASVTGPLADSAVSYVYDALGRITSVAINGTANTSTVAYDTLGRVTTAANNLGTFAYAYVNQTNRLSGVTYPNGQVTNYTYYPNASTTPGNDDQRLAQIANLAATGGANISTFGYTYNAAGNILTWTRQNDTSAALTSSFTYDAIDQLIRATVPTSATATSGYSYGYDKAGNRTREQIDTNVNAGIFNNVNQLTAQTPGGEMEFTGTLNEYATLTLGGKAAKVDASNNWSGTADVTTGANAIPVVATDASGNTTEKTISVTVTGNAERALTYDANGNMISNGAGQTYAWDAANRLTKITYADGSYSAFVYNGLGQRVEIIEKDASGNTTSDKYYVWAGGAQPVEERDASNAVTKRFYGLGEQISGVNYFYTTDHLGSVREMTDAAKTIRARYDYDPYGRKTKVLGDLEADFGFTGFYRHATSGLDLTLYRAYDSGLGRWISRDPIGEDGGLNLYGYVGNNPIVRVDIYGLKSGDAYNSQNEAARAALNDSLPSSINENVEYAGLIYRKNGDLYQYYYTEPIKGSRNKSNPGSCPSGTKPTAYYHTHHPEPNYDTENFSLNDRMATKDINNRIDDTGVDGYLATPNGTFKHLNKNTGHATTLGPAGTIQTE